MKHFAFLSILGGAAAMLLAGCSSIDYTPQGRYDLFTNNRNNEIVLRLHPIKALSPDKVALPANINDAFFQKTLENKFNESKRFSVISADRQDKYKDAIFILDVYPIVKFAYRDTSSAFAIGYEVDMAFNGVNRDGITEFSLNTRGGAADKFTKSFTGYNSGGDTNDVLLTRAIDKCFNQLYPELCRRYPVTGNVTSLRSRGDSVFMQIDRGSEHGILPDENFIVVAIDQDQNEIFVARARAVPARYGSRLEILSWNDDDPDVANFYHPQLVSGNKALLDRLFAVSQSK